MHFSFFKTLTQSRNEQLRYLPQSVKIEEAINPYIVNLSMTLISISIVIFILWASFTEINEIARAEGEVVPQGFVQVVQHLDGGLVTEILTGEGDLVHTGQILIRIDDGNARQDLAEARALETFLELQSERLRAFIENRPPDFSDLAQNEKEVEKQFRMFSSMIEALQKERSVIEDQIAQKNDILDTLNARKYTLKKNIKIAQELIDMSEASQKKKPTSKRDYLKEKKEFNSLQGTLAEALADIAGAQNTLAEYKNRLSFLNANHRNKSFSQLDRIEADLQQNREAKLKFQNRVDRLDIRSPVTGLVKGLKLNTIGGVIKPSQTLMEIVPIDKNLVVEAKISTADVGHMEIGQHVKIKVRSYNFSRYGAIDGRLDFITATTFLDDRKIPYYRGRIVLAQDYVGNPLQQNKILPGMTVEVDIITSKKTIIAYLLKPIGRAMQTAMTER